MTSNHKSNFLWFVLFVRNNPVRQRCLFETLARLGSHANLGGLGLFLHWYAKTADHSADAAAFLVCPGRHPDLEFGTLGADCLWKLPTVKRIAIIDFSYQLPGRRADAGGLAKPDILGWRLSIL